MGITIKIAGAEFAHYVTKPVIPVRSGLVGEFYFGAKEGDNLRNWADETKPLTQYGVITQDDFASIAQSKVAGYSSQAFDTPSFTLVWIGKSTNTASGFAIGSGTSTAWSGIAAFKAVQENTPFYTADNSGSPNFIQNFLTPPDTLAQDRIVVGRSEGVIGAPETMWVYTKSTSGVKSNGPQINTHNRTSTVQPWSIGYSPTSVWNTGEIMTHRAAAVYDRKISDAELQQVVDFYTGYYADRGVTI